LSSRSGREDVMTRYPEKRRKPAMMKEASGSIYRD